MKIYRLLETDEKSKWFNNLPIDRRAGKESIKVADYRTIRGKSYSFAKLGGARELFIFCHEGDFWGFLIENETRFPLESLHFEVEVDRESRVAGVSVTVTMEFQEK